MVRETSLGFQTDLSFQAAAILCLQEGADAYLTDLFETGNLAVIHGKLDCDFLPFKINVFHHYEHSKCPFNV